MSAPGRAATLDALASLEAGADAKTILDEARRIRPGMGQATVFRALRALEAAGLVLRYFDSAGVRRYVLPARSTLSA